MQETIKLCQSLVDQSFMNGPLQTEKTLQDISRVIEKTHKVEKCFILRALGKSFTDNKDVTIEIKECKLLEDITDNLTPITMNDVKNNPQISKEMFRHFSIKPNNLLFIPIVLKKGGQILGVMCIFNKTIQITKKDDQGVKIVTNEPKNMIQSELSCGNKLFIDLLATFFKKENLALTLKMEHQEERKVLTMIDSILRFPTMKRFQEVIEEEFANFFNAERAMIVFVNRYQKWIYRVIYD